MAQLVHLDCKKVIIFSILLFFFVSVCFSACSQHQVQSKQGLSSRIGRRRLLEEQDDEWEEKPLKKKTTTQSQSKKNQTKLTKPTTTTSSKNVKSDSISSTNKNQTKTIKSNSLSTKNNQTKTLKSSTNISSKNQTKTKTIKSENLSSKSSSSSKTTSTDTTSGLKKLNSTSSTSNKSNKKLNSTTTTSSTSKFKKLNSTSKATLSNTPSTSKPTSPSTSSKKPLDLEKATNKTTKSTATKDNKNKQTKTTTNQASDSDQTKPIIKKAQKQSSPPTKKQSPPTSYWMAEEDEDDFVSEFRDLPNKFQQTLLPDLERISTTSKLYLTKANSEITKGFKPYVGKKYASTVATAISCAFVLIPLLLVSLLCTQIKAYFSLQKIIIFTQVYLSIYFTILCVSSLVTGLEPLKFLYSTSQSTYQCLQVLQTLGYVFYLLMLLMYLVLVFSTECGLGSKFLGLAQTLVGIAVGLHYYVTVFHRVVLRQPPKTNWKVHGIYATCFLLICVLSRADRRKKLYVEDGGGEGKQN